MKAITLDPYWAWAVVYGEKRIENRSWIHSHRGPLAIHAGKGRDKQRENEAIEAIRAIDPNSLGTPDQIDMIRGKILGTCDLADIIPETETASPWAFGPFCFLLKEVQPLANPAPRTGKLGIWDCEGV